jgi:hypothetical protein
MLEQPVFMTTGFHTETHNQTARRQTIQFRDHRQRSTSRDESERNLAHDRQRFQPDNSALFVDFKQVVHSDIDPAVGKPVFRDQFAHSFPV